MLRLAGILIIVRKHPFYVWKLKKGVINAVKKRQESNHAKRGTKYKRKVKIEVSTRLSLGNN